MHREATIASKRKQWPREQKLEFVQLLRQNRNKNRVAKEFQSRCKVELNSKLTTAGYLIKPNFDSGNTVQEKSDVAVKLFIEKWKINFINNFYK